MDYLAEKFSVEKSDLPKLLITFKVISTTSYLTTLGLCYKYNPTEKFIQSNYGIQLNNYIKNKFPSTYSKYHTTKNNLINKISSNAYYSSVPKFFGLKSKKFTKAFVENFFLCKITLPITLPLYFYLAYKYIQ